MCLALDELIPVPEVRQACVTPEKAKSVQILFRGQHSLGVWKLAAEQSLAEWYSGRRQVVGLHGYFVTIGGKILDSKEKGWFFGAWAHGRGGVSTEALGWQFWWRGQRWLPSGGLGSGLALIVARLIVEVHGTAVTGVGFLGTSMVMAWSKGFLELVRAKALVFRVRGLGAGMSSVRLVGALGRDQTHVSAGNPTHRKGNGRRGGGREGPVPGAGVGNGGNGVRFQEVPEETAAGKVGVEASGAAPKGSKARRRGI